MKKIVVALLFALMGIVANGQIVKNGHVVEWHVGDYVFEDYWSESFGDDYVDGVWLFRIFMEDDECANLFTFIRHNKEQLEKKYHMVINGVNCDKANNSDRYYVLVAATDADVEREIEERKQQRAQEKIDRMESLNSVF